MINLKQYLLNLELVIDNEYLDKYCKLIEDNKSTIYVKGKSQKHHIVPGYYYKNNNLEIDNSKNNLVNLLIQDHVYAHYYLCKCSKNKDFKYANYCALKYILKNKEVNEDNIKSLIEKLLDNISNNNYNKMPDYMCKLNSIRSKNSRWITNEVIDKFVPIEEVDNYINTGLWRKGRKLQDSIWKENSRLSKIGSKRSQETKEKLRNAQKNRTTINNGKNLKFVKNEELNNYLSTGLWFIGGLPFTEEHKLHIGLANKKPKRKKK